MKKLDQCLEEFGIDSRRPCLKGLEGDCRLREVFDFCSIFHDRMRGQCDELPWDHHAMLKTHPTGFRREKYLEKGIEELKKRIP